jgi:hypothetical protein
MDDTTLSNLITLAAGITFLVSGWATYCIWRARRSGWSRLAAIYGDAKPIKDVAPHRWQTIKLLPGKVKYRRTITLRLTVDGLHMTPALAFRCGHEPLMIPWSDIEIFAVDTAAQDRLYDLKFTHEPAVRARIGVHVAQLIRRAADNAQYFVEAPPPQIKPAPRPQPQTQRATA